MGVRVLALGVACALLAGCASPSSTGEANLGRRLDDQTKLFIQAVATWDQNRDGQVTCDEWKAYLTRLHGATDKNGDGGLDAKEFAALGARDALFLRTGAEFFDTNSNGSVTLPELVGTPNPAFKVLDRDGDCVLGTGDLTTSQQLRRGKEPPKDEPSEDTTGLPPR